jgi:alpha-L-rhamnosidase
VTIPVNTTAQISVPKIGLGDVSLTEGGHVVWQEAAFNPGVAGIADGHDTGDAITFNVGSGSYAFQLRGSSTP